MGRSVSNTSVVPQLQAQYTSHYNDAQSRNDAVYNQILSGYQQQQQATTQGLNTVSAGYAGLSNSVLGGLNQAGRTKSQEIKDAFAQQSGQMAQDMVSRGLGNTTVQGSMQRGLTLDSQKAQIQLAEQVANLKANYQAQIGQQGLSASMQGLGMQAQGTSSLLGALANSRTPYPSWAPMGQHSESSDGSNAQGMGGAGGGGGLAGRFNQGLGGSSPMAPQQYGYNPSLPPPPGEAGPGFVAQGSGGWGALGSAMNSGYAPPSGWGAFMANAQGSPNMAPNYASGGPTDGGYQLPNNGMTMAGWAGDANP